MKTQFILFLLSVSFDSAHNFFSKIIKSSLFSFELSQDHFKLLENYDLCSY